ncbi:juvenile hormone esterase-like isoform X2 [Rhodnius prolixus]
MHDLEARSRREDVEDCLYLNVYTNQVPGKCKVHMAVMFYIHGGSFRVGSAHDFSPNYLLEQDVVLVVIQYRLGPLGFLSLQDESIAGNMGLLDQLLALKWVNKHITQFCGDPNKVTIFGQSSGAAAVSFLMASPLATKDLFQRAIIQSGSGLCDWAVDYNPVEHAIRIAKKVNCTSTKIKEISECLRKASPYDIIIAHSSFLGEVIIMEGQAVKGTNGGNHAVIQTAGKNKFLIEDPKISFETGNFYKMPTMVGVTKHEGTFFLGNIYEYILERKTANNKRPQLDDFFTEVALKFSGIEDTTGAISDVFKDKFFQQNEMGNFTAMIPGLVDICGVTLLKACTLKQARKNSKYNDTFLYTMNYLGHLTKFGYGEEVNYPFPGGVAHSDDLIYLFPYSKGNLSEEEMVVAKTMVELWSNFAIYGKPTPATGVFEWPPMTNNFGPYLRIDAHNAIRQNFIDEYTITIKEGLFEFDSASIPSNAERNNLFLVTLFFVLTYFLTMSTTLLRIL